MLFVLLLTTFCLGKICLIRTGSQLNTMLSKTDCGKNVSGQYRKLCHGHENLKDALTFGNIQHNEQLLWRLQWRGLHLNSYGMYSIRNILDEMRCRQLEGSSRWFSCRIHCIPLNCSKMNIKNGPWIFRQELVQRSVFKIIEMGSLNKYVTVERERGGSRDLR